MSSQTLENTQVAGPVVKSAVKPVVKVAVPAGVTVKQAGVRKRVIWVTGGKGGTGKSTFARGVLDLLMEAGVNVAAFDGDPDNAQLFRFYQDVGKGVTRTSLSERDGGDDILEAMEVLVPDVIVVDVAAGGSQILMRLQDESLFLSTAQEMGYDFTVVSVLSPIKDSVNMLKEALDTTEGHDVQHVAVKNLHFGSLDDFELFEASKTREQFVSLGGQVVAMRDLLGKTYGALDRDNLSFLGALDKETGLPSGDRCRIRQWRTCLRDQLMQHSAAFGLQGVEA